jgi:hypothetical protein
MTGSGIVVDGGSSNITIENIHAYDIYRHALIINTGSYVHITKFTASEGCSSSAILIGQFPAAYGLSVNKDLTDVFLNNIYIANVKSDGLGIWNCSGGDGYSSVCKRINTNGLIVRNWGMDGLGYAYWGSGIGGTYASEVNLFNFAFDNSGAGSSNQGRGLHIEHGYRWNHVNGNIANLVTGGSDPRTGYAITCSGGSKIAYGNINIDNVGIGVLANGGVNVSFDHVFVSFALYQSYYIGGIRVKFFDCSGIQDAGGANAAWGFYATSPLSITDVLLDSCYGRVDGGETPHGFQVFGPNLVNMKLRNLGSGNPVAINTGGDGQLHQKIHGDIVSVRLRQAVSEGTSYDIPIVLSPAQTGNRIFIINAYLSFSNNITQDASSYNNYNLYKRTASGAISALSSNGLNSYSDNFTALKPVPFKIHNYANAHIAEGDTLFLKRTVVGAGRAEYDGVLTIEYVSY